MFPILSKRALNEAATVYEFRIRAPLAAAHCRAGQFVIIQLDEQGERIPLTVDACDAAEGSVTVMVQAAGFTTRLLCGMEAGDELFAVAGPLGRATELKNGGNIAVVGGGVGCAIAWPVARAFRDAGCHVDLIAGFRSRDIVMLEEEMRRDSSELFLCTDDGSYGEKCFGNAKLEALIREGRRYDEVFIVGPPIMMKFTSLTTRPYGIYTVASLCPVMIDGSGMCGGCRVTVGGETRFACVDGPDFDAHQVDWDELIARCGFYADEEAEAREHNCRMTGGVRHG